MTDPQRRALALALLPLLSPDLAPLTPTESRPMLRAVASRTMQRTAAPYVVGGPERVQPLEA